MERSLIGCCEGVDVGMSIKKELDALVLTFQCCEMERQLAVGITSMDVGMSIKKELHGLMTAIP